MRDRFDDRNERGDRTWGQREGFLRRDDRRDPPRNDDRGWRNDRGEDWRSDREHWDEQGQRPDERYGAQQEMWNDGRDYNRRDRGFRDSAPREFSDRDHAGSYERAGTWSAGHGGGTEQRYGGGLQSWQDRNVGSGKFAGRGPKNWQRSDERIREEVNDYLTDHPDVDASEVEVAVSGGEVTLTGTVSDRHEKRAAEDCAWRAHGVRDVHNQLRIGVQQNR